MTEFYHGQVVFDKKRTDPTNDLLVVTDPDVGTVGSLRGETKRLVKHNGTNKDFFGNSPVPDDEPCVAVAYVNHGDHIEPSIEDSTYTFPRTRLEVVESEKTSALEGYQPYQWALAGFLSELIQAFDDEDMTLTDVDDLQVLCMQASIDGKVITRATQWGLSNATVSE